MPGPYPTRRLFFIYALLCILTPWSGLYAQERDSAVFKDEFNRSALGTFWDAQGSWSIQNGSAFNFIDGTGGSLKTTKAYAQDSYIIETTAKGFTGSYYREFRITFGQASLSSQALYQLKYTAYGGGRLTLSRSTENIYFPQVLDEAAIFPNFNSSEWYTFKIAKYKSGLIQVFVDGGSGYSSVPLLEAIDLTHPELGYMGWQIDTQTFAETFNVDWIAVSKPGVEKPALPEKPLEDSLITQVSAESRNSYEVGKLVTGSKQFSDRNHTITSFPLYLNGASYIRTANDDKSNDSNNFLTFFLKAPAILYVAYDPRSETIPAWLSQWTKTTDRIKSSDSKQGYLDIYTRLVDYGEVYPYPVILGGNLAAPALGSKSNYLVAAVRRPDIQSLQAEDALLDGPEVANTHFNYNGTGYADFMNASDDFIEWTIKIDIPGIYNLGFRFSNGGFDTRALQLTENKTILGKVEFSPTSAWDSWDFLGGPNVNFSAGTHKIRLTATGQNGPNIDELSLFFLSQDNPVALSKNSSLKHELTLTGPAFRSGAYPNPFLQNTKIYYGVKEKAKVILSVYNLQGQNIGVLENAVLEAGNYQSNFEAVRLPKGTYIFKLQIGNEVKTGRLVKE